MRLKIYLISGLLVLSFTSQTLPQEDLEKLPGYVDFNSMGLFGEEEATIEVFLKGSLLNLIAEVTKLEDPELAELLSKLKVIRVQTFSLRDQKIDEVKQKMAEMARQLEKKDWEMVVRVREKDENVYVYIKSENKKTAGLVIMSIEPHEEAVFVNIVGEIDPAQLGRIGRKFNFDTLDSIRIEKKRKAKP